MPDKPKRVAASVDGMKATGNWSVMVMDPAFLTWHQRMVWTVSVKQSAVAVRKR